MKRIFNKLEAGLVSFRIALISYPFKVKGQYDEPLYGVNFGQELKRIQPEYGVREPIELIKNDTSIIESTPTLIDSIIKIVPRLLIAITFIVGIISFIKIRRIEDEAVKEKRTKKTIIIIFLLIILIIGILLLKLLLNK